jgi:hypothetical protein
VELEVQGLMMNAIVEANSSLMRGECGVVWARLEIAQYAPCLTFYDPGGKERRRVAWWTDGSPLLCGE